MNYLEAQVNEQVIDALGPISKQLHQAGKSSLHLPNRTITPALDRIDQSLERYRVSALSVMQYTSDQVVIERFVYERIQRARASTELKLQPIKAIVSKIFCAYQNFLYSAAKYIQESEPETVSEAERMLLDHQLSINSRCMTCAESVLMNIEVILSMTKAPMRKQPGLVSTL